MLWTRDHVTDEKRYISTSAKTIDRMVGSNTGLISTKSHNLLITWSHKVIQQMKNVINSFSHELRLLNLTEGWLMTKSHMSNNKVTYPSDHAVVWGHVTKELHYIFILRSLLQLKLIGWWLVKLKSRQTF